MSMMLLKTEQSWKMLEHEDFGEIEILAPVPSNLSSRPNLTTSCLNVEADRLENE